MFSKSCQGFARFLYIPLHSAFRKGLFYALAAGTFSEYSSYYIRERHPRVSSQPGVYTIKTLIASRQNYLSKQFYSDMADNRYVVGYAKLGTSSCKKCKQKIDKGGLRIGKVVANPFGDDGGDMKQWFHPSCIFETFVRARATTKKIEEPDDMEGFGDLKQEDKDAINQLIDGKKLELIFFALNNKLTSD
jgi:hypothetical protein